MWHEHREVADTLHRDQLTQLRYVRYNSTSGGPAFVDAQLANV